MQINTFDLLLIYVISMITMNHKTSFLFQTSWYLYLYLNKCAFLTSTICFLIIHNIEELLIKELVIL